MHLPFSCRCGAVAGEVRNHTRRGTNRGVCYCNDCRVATRWLDRDDLLDERGGIDIFQVAQGQVVLTQGHDLLATMRLSRKGLWRAYTTCCKTPLGNTLSAGVPFVGLPVAIVAPAHHAELPAPFVFNAKSALSPVPGDSKWAQAKMVGRVVRLMLGWKLRGMSTPSIYFDNHGASRLATTILSREERMGLG